MKPFTLAREVALDPQEAWDRVTDWERHARHVPLTRIRLTADGFVARTGVGPFAFDDPMRTEIHEPPHRSRVIKTGRVIRGHVDVRFDPIDGQDGTMGTRVTWTETVAIRGVPAFLDPVVGFFGRRLFGRVIDRLLAT